MRNVRYSQKVAKTLAPTDKRGCARHAGLIELERIAVETRRMP
jgi:hypothetical protein